MKVCERCGRASEQGKYCRFCGTLLKERSLSYESTGTLLRSQIVLDRSSPPAGKPCSPPPPPAESRDINSFSAGKWFLTEDPTGYGDGFSEERTAEIPYLYPFTNDKR